MKGVHAISAAVALGSFAHASLTPVIVKGNAFFAGDKRFYLRGVDYQPGGSSVEVDPLANPSICKRDIPYFKELGINTIRVYAVDNSANHDECMSALNEAGIYLALDVNNDKYSLNRADPAPSYNNVYLQSVFATVDAFAKYENTLLFYAGNEVINSNPTTQAAPYVKAVIRDIKTYIQARGYRQIPVGYSAADVPTIYDEAMYFNCGDNGYARSDFFALNDYQWCGSASSYVISGYQALRELYSNYSIPLFFSEYGCIDPLPRTFDEVGSIYNTNQMTPVLSGGLVYEYSEEPDPAGYGLVKINGNSVQTMSSFNTLKEKFAQYPIPSGTGGYQTGLKPLDCPSYNANKWRVKTEGLPAIPAPAEKYMKTGAGPGPGLKGKGSQDTGVDSTGFVTVSNAGITQSSAAGSAPSTDPTSDSGSGGSSGALSIRPSEWPISAMVSGLTVLISTFAGAVLL